MAIKTVGVKRLQGLKLDRVSDSLGSSADGTNTNVTQPKAYDATTIGSNITVTNGQISASGVALNGDNRVYKSLGMTLSDDWVADFDFNVTSIANNAFALIFVVTAGSSDLDNGTSQDNIKFFLDDDSLNSYMRSQDGATQGTNTSGLGSLSTGTTYYARIIKDGTSGTIELYSSSARTGTPSNSATTTFQAVTGLTHFQSGAMSGGNSGNGTWVLDNVKIWDDSTTASGTPDFSEDFATNPNAGQKLGTGCYDYAGGTASSPRVELGDDLADWTFLTNGSDWTWVGWWNPDSFSFTSGVYGTNLLYTMEAGSSSNTGMNIYVDGDGDISGVMLRSVGGSYVFTNADSGANLITGEWQHLAVVHDGTASTMKFYVNGVLGGTLTGTGNAYSSAENPRQPMIGGVGSGTRGWSEGFNGKSDDMAFYKRKLSVTEIQALVNNVDKTANFTSDFSSSTGWTEAGAGTATIDVNTSTEKIDWAIRTDGSDNNRLWYDLQSSNALGSGNNASDDKWVLRFKWTPTWYTNSDGTQPMIFCMLAATGNADRTIDDDCIGFAAWNSSNNNYRRGLDVNDDVWGDGNSNMEFIGTAYGSSNINGDEWVEIKRNSSTSYTVSFYSDEFVTLRHSMTRTASGISGITNLRYIKFAHRVDDDTPTAHPSGTIEDVQFWNNVDQAYDTNGALVTSISKEGLKAYYSMNSLALDVAKTHEDDFNYADQSAGDTKWVRNDTVNNKMRYNNTNKNLDFNYDSDNSNDSIGTDLGSNLNNSSWVARFKLVISSLSTGGSCDMYIGMSSVSETSSAGTSQQFIGVDLKNEPSGNQKFGGNDGSSGTLVRAPQDPTANGSLSTGTYYMQITRLTATTYTIKIFDDSDYSTLLYTIDGTSDSITSLRYFVLRVREASGATAVIQGTIDDLEIWDGTTLVGCQNDFSATSDLEALTGVRTNTIFEQTDTPEYWWYNGTKWKTDGGNILLVDNVQKSNTGWTFATGSTAGSANAYAKLDGSSIRCIDDSTGTGHSVIYDLGSALSNKWVIRFKIVTNKTVSRSSNQTGVAVGMFSGAVTVDGESSQDFIGFNNYNDTQGHILAQYTNNQAPSATNQTAHFSSGTGNPHGHDDGYTAYCEMIRDEGTTTYKMYTDEYSTLIGTNTYSTGTSDVTGLRYFGCKGEGFSDSASHVDTSISQIEIYDGVTSV